MDNPDPHKGIEKIFTIIHSLTEINTSLGKQNIQIQPIISTIVNSELKINQIFTIIDTIHAEKTILRDLTQKKKKIDCNNRKDWLSLQGIKDFLFYPEVEIREIQEKIQEQCKKIQKIVIPVQIDIRNTIKKLHKFYTENKKQLDENEKKILEMVETVEQEIKNIFETLRQL